VIGNSPTAVLIELCEPLIALFILPLYICKCPSYEVSKSFAPFVLPHFQRHGMILENDLCFQWLLNSDIILLKMNSAAIEAYQHLVSRDTHRLLHTAMITLPGSSLVGAVKNWRRIVAVRRHQWRHKHGLAFDRSALSACHRCRQIHCRGLSL
jgi:hypothetical protein